MACGKLQVDMDISITNWPSKNMIRYHDAGFTSWDFVDIYGPAEDFIGDFRRKLLALKGKEEEPKRIQALTKWVPQPGIITRSMVNESIQRSLREWLLIH
jgi:hypothetical protein